MTQNRTHTCNELRMEHAGQKVKLSGWMENVREVGQNFAFVILRDFYGTTQVVIETEEMMEIIHGLNKSIAAKTASMVSRAKGAGPFMMTGGVARNLGVVHELESRLGSSLFIAENPDLCGALGAALFAIDEL